MRVHTWLRGVSTAFSDGTGGQGLTQGRPVKARFGGTVTLDPTGAPDAFNIVGEGKGGAAGFAKGGAVVKLVEVEGGTLLHYDAHAEVGGRIAQLGSRLIRGTASKLSSKFFESLAAAVDEIDQT